LGFTVWSFPQVSTAVAEPFCSVLCVHSLLVHTDGTVMYDNEALLDICRSKPNIKHANSTKKGYEKACDRKDNSTSEHDKMNGDKKVNGVQSNCTMATR